MTRTSLTPLAYRACLVAGGVDVDDVTDIAAAETIDATTSNTLSATNDLHIVISSSLTNHITIAGGIGGALGGTGVVALAATGVGVSVVVRGAPRCHRCCQRRVSHARGR